MKSIKSFKKGVFQITDSQIAWAMLAIGLIVVVVGGAKLFSSTNTAADLNAYAAIMTEMRQLRPSTGYGTNDYVPVLVKKDVLPKSVNISNGVIYNRSGGAISVTGNGQGFTMTTTKLSEGECMEYAPKLSLNNVAVTTINGTAISGEVSSAAAAQACASGSANQISFKTNS
ncbi:hypothetical protein FZI27_20085 [Cronobacter sakazakii]|nr:hypothetical protein FZI27_20085 [Cronobacter sakazakii]